MQADRRLSPEAASAALSAIRPGTLPVCEGSGMRLGRRTVLVVGDEESITTPLVEALVREGCDVSVARTGAAAATTTEAR